MVTVAAILFGIGLIALAALFLTPLLDHGVTAPTWVYALTPLAPVGFIAGVVGVVLGNIAGDKDD